MPKKITKYQAIDGSEHETFQKAHDHEITLALIKNVRGAVADCINSYRDEKLRPIYNISQDQAFAFADMLVMTDLLMTVNTLAKGAL